MTDDRTTVQTAGTQAATTPEDAIAWLEAGNERFAGGRSTERDLLTQAAATADGQYPLAAVVGCIDSRVPVEAVLDAGIGDVFVARTAGNVVDDDVLGSLEFASALAGVKAIVVLGHSACGAVMGACDGAELGHLTGLLAKITPAVVEASGGDPAPGSDDPDLVQRAVEANVRRVAATIRDRSDVIAGLCDDGDLVVRGAWYDLATGRVAWLDATPSDRPDA
jgi:carbonic anhydrase